MQCEKSQYFDENKKLCVECPPNTVSIHNKQACGMCDKGNFPENSFSCVKCSVGYFIGYNKISEQSHCYKCPGKLVTKQEGSSSIQDCVRQQYSTKQDQRYNLLKFNLHRKLQNYQIAVLVICTVVFSFILIFIPLYLVFKVFHFCPIKFEADEEEKKLIEEKKLKKEKEKEAKKENKDVVDQV